MQNYVTLFLFLNPSAEVKIVLKYSRVNFLHPSNCFRSVLWRIFSLLLQKKIRNVEHCNIQFPIDIFSVRGVFFSWRLHLCM
jgi:hypothetical protein